MTPLSPTIAAALNRIAALAASDGSPQERLELVLSAAREALGLGSLSVVATGSAPDDVKAWHSTGKNFRSSRSRLEAEVLKLVEERSRPSTSDDAFVFPLTRVNGYKAAIVGRGVSSKTDAVLLEAVSKFIAVLVENVRLEDEARVARERANRRIEEIAAIYDIGKAIEPHASTARVLDLIVEKAAAVMDAQTCSLMLRDPEDGCLVIKSSFGLDEEIVRGVKIGIGEGIAGRVLETGEPMMITDVSTDPRLGGSVKSRPGVSGSMCVPLRNEDGAVTGVLSIRRHDPSPPFTTDDLKLFSVFATHASLAISNSQLYLRLQRKIQEMSTISEVLRAINSTLELDRVLELIVESITDVVGFDRCCVYLLDARTNEFVAGARKGYGEDDIVKDRIKSGEGVIGLAAKEQIPIFSQGSPIESEGAEHRGEFLAAPIMVRDQCIGVVVVDNCVLNRPIEPNHVGLLATFVSQVGIAVENARLYEAMEEKYGELNTLYEHSKEISAAYGLDNAAETLVKATRKIVRSDAAALLLLDAKRGRLDLQAHSGGTAWQWELVKTRAREPRAVNYVRDIGSPVLLPWNCPERTTGANADLLNTLAPEKAYLMLTPLVVEDTTVGVLAVCRGKGLEFQSSELKLMSILASHAAVVLRNAMNYEQKMRQKVLELTALYEFSKRISSAENLEEALDSILGMVGTLVDYDEAFIYVIDHELNTARVTAARFRADPVPQPQKVRTEEPLDGDSVTSWTIKEKKAFVTPDVSRDERFGGSQCNGREPAGLGGWLLQSDRPVKSLMSVPLMVQDDVVGVLVVHSYSPNQYSEDDVRAVSVAASQGAAIYKELEALSALTSYTDNILSSIAAGVVTLDSDGTILTWNTAAEKIVEFRAAQVVGRDYKQVLRRMDVSGDDRAILNRAVSDVLQGGETYHGYKMCFHSRSRGEVYVNISISPLLNSAGEQLGLVIIFEDITSGIRMENEFRRMGELAAVGQLAASIAHELRNPLSSIKGAAQYLRKEYEDHPSVVEFLDIIVEEVNGLNKLTTDFLDFARPMELELRPTSISRVVEKTLQLMSVHIADSNVIVKEKLAADLPEIHADAKQIEQVLKNIIINALQAMPEGGLLTVETGPAPAGVYFSISDTGIGIPEDKLDRIFLPFVTTKTKGTGLGLSIVHRIIENHGGRIEVASKVGEGSTFKVYLPLIGPRPAPGLDSDETLERRTPGKLKWSSP